MAVMLAVYHVVEYAPITLPCNQCYGPTILPQTSKKTYNNTVSSTTVVVYTGKYNYDALAAVVVAICAAQPANGRNGPQYFGNGRD